ncbi:MAG: Smr/MutS family protein [Pseudomonadota bacterium]
MRRKKPPIVTTEDRTLFRDAVADVRRLDFPAPENQRVPPAPIPHQRLQDEQRVMQESMAPFSLDEETLDTGDALSFRRAEVPPTVMRKLRRGQYAVQAELDLHGLTVVAAANALSTFLHACQARGLRTLRIIHGKGNGSAA